MRGPQGSSGALALQVSGTPGTAIPTYPAAGSVLTHADGTSYKVTTVGGAIGGAGTAIVDIAAISTGLATNKVAGEALAFSNPALNINAQAVLVANLANGLLRQPKVSATVATVVPTALPAVYYEPLPDPGNFPLNAVIVNATTKSLLITLDNLTWQALT